jgi:hypothetical protein
MKEEGPTFLHSPHSLMPVRCFETLVRCSKQAAPLEQANEK